MTRAELLERLDVLLGRRTAEGIVFGDVSTGARVIDPEMRLLLDAAPVRLRVTLTTRYD
ncbi:MAG: hypothetical protein AB7N91_21510 [Candidatus Tectimicrobiota bacterium]